MVSARSLALPRPAAGARRRAGGRRRRIVLALVAAAALVGLGWAWVRDSHLVAVESVVVTGARGPEAADVRRALETAARDMTVLHVRRDELETAVAPFRIVKSLSVASDFPHGLRIRVRQHQPVASVIVDGRRTPVSADGTLLRGTSARDVPVVPLKSPPAGDRVLEPAGRDAIAVIAAAPEALRARVARVHEGAKGLTVTLRRGPPLHFGTDDRLRAKWAAVARVFADPSAAGATYLDVRVPGRPAAGGLEQIAGPESALGSPPAGTNVAGALTQPSTGG